MYLLWASINVFSYILYAVSWFRDESSSWTPLLILAIFELITLTVYVGFVLFTSYLSPSFLVAMKHYQHYEYKRHWKKIASIFFIFTALGISFSMIIAMCTAGFFATYFDNQFNLSPKSSYAMFYFIPDNTKEGNKTLAIS
jgi:hypothetical protein